MNGFSSPDFIVSTVLAGLLAATGCSAEPAKPVDKPAPTKAPANVPVEPAASPEQPASAPPANSETQAVTELSEEDKRLIAADPRTLSVEDRRKRAFAVRRKIMQNPDSATAQTLEELRRAHEAGQLSGTKANELHFESPQNPPAGASPTTAAPADAKQATDDKASKRP